MSITLTIREFKRHVGRAKLATEHEPVFITVRGRPSYVLLSVEKYQNMVGAKMTILDALGQEDIPDFEFDPPRRTDLPREIDVAGFQP